jgi:hypothetical protein
MDEPRWIAGTCPPPYADTGDPRDAIARLNRTSGSDGLNGCPTVLQVGDAVVVQGYELDPAARAHLRLPDGASAVVVTGRPLDPAARARLRIPAGEDAVEMPKSIYAADAEVPAEG